MSLLHPLEKLLVNLEEDIPLGFLFVHMPKETALRLLVEKTGQDFGYDAKRWRLWLEENALVPKRNIPKEMLQVLENDFPPGYIRCEEHVEAAIRRLREWTGQDFGPNPKAWREWLETQGVVHGADRIRRLPDN